ncbi:non-ribosomal peptide synthetase, partial [Streptomyces sp. SBT349]|uniref:non-ribosomal peptide synthetase n=1 Tax=Streptomyces sp. SBT349 TaxID=1580539 RepID=UPI001F2AE2AF
MLNPPRTLTHHPLFQTMLILQNNTHHHTTLGNLTLQNQPVTLTGAKFDLSLSVGEVNGGGLTGVLEYATDLFDRTTAQSLSHRLARTLAALAHHPTTPISHIDILSPAERHQVLTEWNDTRREVPAATLPALFEAQAAATPHNVAVVCQDTELTYTELNTQANRLAHHLIDLGIGPEELVAVAVPRSADMVVALLAILKTGAAYLPIDTEYPRERIAFLLQDATPARVITTTTAAPALPQDNPPLILDDPTVRNTLTRHPASNPADSERTSPLSLTHPAYVIYTSGSTGRPKGVTVTHQGIASLVANQATRYNVGPNSRILQFASPSFDAAVWETCMALLTGARLVLALSSRLQAGPPLCGLMAQHAITHATLPPAVLTAMGAEDRLPKSTTIIVAGEASSAELVARWAPGRKMINAYGPTEFTVCATSTGPLVDIETPPIGRPFWNTQVFVLDGRLDVVPPGVVGELYVAGAGAVSFS